MKPAQTAFSFFISITIFLASTTISFLLTIILGGLFGIYGLIALTMLYMLSNLCKINNNLSNKFFVAGVIIGTGIGLMVVVKLLSLNLIEKFI